MRNRYGFVMFLGHGAILRRSCWQQVGGFPEVVSEDLAYAIAIREKGYYGTFAKDVTCFEEFPESVRSFRVRHVKWTRGTCEFLHHYGLDLLRSSRISWSETHPDAKGVQRFEWFAATVFAIGAVASFQIALFGIAIAYGLISVMHNSDWGRPGLQTLVWLPFSFIATGLALGGMGLFGMQAVFFGFGFHF